MEKAKDHEVAAERDRLYGLNPPRLNVLDLVIGPIGRTITCSARACSSCRHHVHTPPPKGGGFRPRLKAGSVRHAADSGHLEVVIRLRRRLVFDVLHPDLVSDVTAARYPGAPRPQVLRLRRMLNSLSSLVNSFPSGVAPRETRTGSTAAYVHGRG